MAIDPTDLDIAGWNGLLGGAATWAGVMGDPDVNDTVRGSLYACLGVNDNTPLRSIAFVRQSDLGCGLRGLGHRDPAGRVGPGSAVAASYHPGTRSFWAAVPRGPGCVGAS